jgi:uncharacterized membrane protein YhhN
MRKNLKPILGVLAGAAVLFALGGNLLGVFWLICVFKPLATFLLASLAFVNWRAGKSSYALFVAIGLFFSVVGDAALIWPGKYFVPGLIAFLLAHLAYLAAFTRGVRFPARLPVLLLYLLIGAVLFLYLHAKLPAALDLPVALYALVLASMAAQAMGRYLVLRTSAALLAALGGLFFMVSDSLLAIHRFRAPLPHDALLVLVPYYVAQAFFALSTQPANEAISSRTFHVA